MFCIGGVTLGPQAFLDINMLVSATRKSRVEGIAQREPQHEWFCIAVEYRLFHCDAKPLALGPGIRLDPERDDFALPIPHVGI